ncbi:PH and SEC7 domain-containing 1-like isoform X2 [Paramuricea clavata]|uniref:PH and SEC7 domain-containing 1-like isoform X2 n=1 Tax=Paramuricea clavata TaxID=317549 RepID=A0A7D9DHH2_PARCT|nr:PH and SEC7 domain-containing 1-like isoform X2 [Paramuricea clavata]
MSDSKIVEIERNVGGSFGFSVIGGVDTELPPMVCALVHNGSAQLSGKIHVGDVLVEVNDECVSRLPAKKVVESLKLSPDTLKLRLRKGNIQ